MLEWMKNNRKLLSLTWLLALCAVIYLFTGLISSINIQWQKLDYINALIGIAGGVLFCSPMAWVTFDYFKEIHTHRQPIKISVILTFLPFIGKYIPGKIWSVTGFIAWARSLVGISVKDSGMFQVYTQITSIISTIILASIGLLLFNKNIGTEVQTNFWFTSAALFVICVAGIFTFHNIARRLNHNFLIERLPIHIVAFMLQKLLRSIAIYYFLSACLPVSHIPIEIMLAFVIAMQIGAMAFFAPAGIGATEGVYVLTLSSSGVLPIELALQVALFARIWQTITDVTLSLIGYLTEISLKKHPERV